MSRDGSFGSVTRGSVTRGERTIFAALRTMNRVDVTGSFPCCCRLCQRCVRNRKPFTRFRFRAATRRLVLIPSRHGDASPKRLFPTPHAFFVSLFSDHSVRCCHDCSLPCYRRGRRRFSSTQGSFSAPCNGGLFPSTDSARSVCGSSQFARCNAISFFRDACSACREPIVAACPISCALNRPAAEPVAGGSGFLGDLGGRYGERRDALCPKW